jgi:hypothetical protein
MSQYKVEKAEDIVQEGQAVFVKVISYGDDPDAPKISLSIKGVGQADGKDSDPTNLQASRDSRKGRGFQNHESNRFDLGAVFNVTCSKCGCAGHLPKDCFNAGKKYEMLEDPGPDEEGGTVVAEPAVASSLKKKHHKHGRSRSRSRSPSHHKKHKKKDKKKRKKSSSKSSSQHKRHRHHSHPSSDSGSDSDGESSQRHRRDKSLPRSGDGSRSSRYRERSPHGHRR